MSLSRRGALAGIGVAGIGLLTACAKAVTPTPEAGRITRALWTPSPAPQTAVAAPSASATASASAAATAAGTPSAAATAARSAAASASASPTASPLDGPTASASATATPSGTPTASASPTPVATRAMPTASASATATATATATAVPSAAPASGGRFAYASGSSCIGAADGEFGRWRGKTVQAASTWGRDGETFVVDPGAEYGSWTGHLDYAPQYDLERGGGPFTWSAMASGSFDARLRSDMRALKARWGSRPGTLNYRFQHEFNGDWYRWSVDSGNASAMVTGWRRMAGIFRDVFGSDERFRIAWSPNAGSAPKKFGDIRAAWPGAQYVDVISIDFYDFFKPRNDGDWNRMLNSVDSGGGPVGIGAWQSFAEKQGVPWAVAEWGNQYGDNPLYIQRMHDLFAQHAYSGSGSAAGKLVYEVYFNQVFDGGSASSSGDFRVESGGRDLAGRPAAAARYRQLFGA